MYDMLIIGGGINGAGIARDAAGRGLKVLLCEKGDLASATSSASSKLIHGGLRYLESYEFRLVRESLGERETLLSIAPHIIWPLRFVLPVDKGMRPAWMLRAGLFLYDNLAKRAILPGAKTLNLRNSVQGAPLQNRLARGFEYSDCWADDARLVVLNAVDAAEHGAEICVRTECIALTRSPEHWAATLRTESGLRRDIQARVVVNAAGPWVEDVLGQIGRKSNTRRLRLVKGSHIVTRKLFEGEQAYIFQSGDGRVIFVIPYERDFTLIGTTDIDWSPGQGEVKISSVETDYLCGAVSAYFRRPVQPSDVVWSYAGVRPLFDDQSDSASVVTRDYAFELEDAAGSQAPILSIYGGKLTTYRKLAEAALEKLSMVLGAYGPSWTASAPLPGGDLPQRDFKAFYSLVCKKYGWLPDDVRLRLARAYGSRIDQIIGAAASTGQLGHHFGAGLYEAEVDHLRTHEFARSADDILWRRTKLGLRMSDAEQADLQAWTAQRQAA
jgi:glycerol-3-phosphate dehydrogenase